MIIIWPYELIFVQIHQCCLRSYVVSFLENKTLSCNPTLRLSSTWACVKKKYPKKLIVKHRHIPNLVVPIVCMYIYIYYKHIIIHNIYIYNITSQVHSVKVKPSSFMLMAAISYLQLPSLRNGSCLTTLAKYVKYVTPM